MKERLEEIPAIKGRVVIFSRSSIEDDFNARMEKSDGRCVIIRLVRSKNMSPDHKKARRQGIYSVTLFTDPLLEKKAAEKADEIMDAIDAKLQGWWPAEVPSNGLFWCGCGEGSFPDDNSDFDLSQILVTAPQKIS